MEQFVLNSNVVLSAWAYRAGKRAGSRSAYYAGRHRAFRR
jgi:hypothetical protein